MHFDLTVNGVLETVMTALSQVVFFGGITDFKMHLSCLIKLIIFFVIVGCCYLIWLVETCFVLSISSSNRNVSLLNDVIFLILYLLNYFLFNFFVVFLKRTLQIGSPYRCQLEIIT